MAKSESSSHYIVSPPLVDLRLLSQSELYSLSFSASTGIHRRSDEDSVIPKIDRSVFNESAGSRKQTFSRLRLAPRNKQNSSVPASSSSLHIPLRIPEPLDEENSQIIALLQELFGVESLRDTDDDRLVPVQVEFKQPFPESAAGAFQNIPIDVVDSGQRKRKRGRPRKNEDGEREVKVVAVVNEKKGLVVDADGMADVGDPFAEELIGRTQGMETESQLLEFLEGLNGEWGSQRKKRRIVEARDLCDLLPAGWKIVLTLQRRAGRASLLCRRYISPEGHQFESYKEVSAHLLSFCGVQDIRHLKSSYTDGSQQFSCNVNMASESQVVGHVSTGEVKTDANVSSSHQEKQASISSSIRTEKLNASDGNFNSDLALGCKLGDTTSGAFRDSDHQTDNKQPLKDDKNDANSVQGCSPAEDRVHNVHNEKLAGAIEASDATCNLYIPLVFTSPFSNNGSGIDQFSDEINAVTCMKSGIANFDSQDRSTGRNETVPCGNDRVHVDNNGLELSVRLVEDHVQKMGFESSMLAPNSEGNISTGNNSEDRHLSSLVDLEISDGKPVKDDKQQLVSSRDQSEIKDVSTNVKLQYSSDGCSLVPSQNELKQSINGMDRTLTLMLKDSAEVNYFDNDLPSLSIDERTCIHNGYSDFTPNLEVPKDGSDNQVPPNEEVVASCLQKRSSANNQICTMDHLLDGSESNLFTLTGNQHMSTYHDMNNFSAGTFDALKAVDAGCLKPQLGIVSCSNVVAVDAYTSARVMQEKSQGCLSVPLGGSILNQFDKQSDGAVNKAYKSCLSEKAKSEVEIFQTESMECPGNHKALLLFSQFPSEDDSLEKTIA